MIKKIIFILTVIFSLRLLISCCNPGEPGRYIIDIVEAEIGLFELSDSSTLEPIDSLVSRADFRLLTDFRTDYLIDTLALSFQHLSFSSARACSQADNIDRYVEFVSKLKIFSVDSTDNNRMDITESFAVIYEGGAYTEVQRAVDWRTEALKEISPMQRYNFDFAFIRDYERIPSGSIFEVEFTMTSGEILSAQSAPVYFSD